LGLICGLYEQNKEDWNSYEYPLSNAIVDIIDDNSNMKKYESLDEKYRLKYDEIFKDVFSILGDENESDKQEKIEDKLDELDDIK
jgi:hypothetical protein